MIFIPLLVLGILSVNKIQKNLADDLNVPLLAEIPIIQDIREDSDIGRPVVLQETTTSAKAFIKLANNVLEQVKSRNENLNPTEVVKITNMDGCSS